MSLIFERHTMLAQEKRDTYKAEDPDKDKVCYSDKICDAVRGMVVCGKVEDLLDSYRAVMKEFNIVEGRGRVKANFSLENNIKNENAKPPDM